MKIIQGDCLEELKQINENSVDSIVTDPPYGLEFMGKEWDKFGKQKLDIWGKGGVLPDNVPRFRRISLESWKAFQEFCEQWAIECLRVIKPGGYLLSFGGSRTYHRMTCGIEDAGFEIRDQIMWVYGSGFPKSLNIGKAINKIDGVRFDKKPASGVGFMNDKDDGYNTTKNQLIQNGDSSERSKQWEGWGTALKPAHEPIVVARKPLSEKTVAANVLKWGTGGINIDGSRVEASDGTATARKPTELKSGAIGYLRDDKPKFGGNGSQLGRFPANFIHDGSDEVVRLFPDTKGVIRKPTGKGILNPETGWNQNSMTDETVRGFVDSGSAARFFYTAKASKSERNAGLGGLEHKQTTGGGGGIGDYKDDVNSMSGKYGSEKAPARNHHPTVKPVSLMKYLIKLVTPPKGTVLDPFMGSGTTGVACKELGFEFIGIEREEEYIKIAEARIKNVPKTLL